MHTMGFVILGDRRRLVVVGSRIRGAVFTLTVAYIIVVIIVLIVFAAHSSDAHAISVIQTIRSLQIYCGIVAAVIICYHTYNTEPKNLMWAQKYDFSKKKLYQS